MQARKTLIEEFRMSEVKKTRKKTRIAVVLATFTMLTTVPNLSADAAPKFAKQCVVKKGKRVCKLVRVRTKQPTAALALVTPASSVPAIVVPTDVVVTPTPTATVPVAPAAAPPVVPATVAVVLVTPATPIPTPTPATPAAPQPATAAPVAAATPVTAPPLPTVTTATTTPKPATPNTPSTPSTPTVSLGMVHKIGDAPIDDYPAALKNAAQGSAYDALRFPNRECTSFVVLRMAADGRPLENFFYQQTSTWAERAAQAGYAVDANPRPGDIAHWVANEKQTFPDGSWTQAGPVGHVGYVAAVNPDGSVTLEEYNGANVRGTYSVRYNTRAPRYIHYKN
jgi:surface antigen